MNLRTLRAFVEVVRQGGFSQAAQVVSLTQSTVSKAVKSLEDELGTPLFNRAGHKVELTAAGEIAYRRAFVLLSERSDMLKSTSCSPSSVAGCASACHRWAVACCLRRCLPPTASATRRSISN